MVLIIYQGRFSTKNPATPDETLYDCGLGYGSPTSPGTVSSGPDVPHVNLLFDPTLPGTSSITNYMFTSWVPFGIGESDGKVNLIVASLALASAFGLALSLTQSSSNLLPSPKIKVGL